MKQREVITVNESERPETIVLRPVPDAAKHARDFVASIVSEWGDEDYIPRLVVSELVTNAIWVSEPDGHIVVRAFRGANGETVIECWDEAPGTPARRQPGAGEERGRGLLILSDVVERWGRRPLNGPGKVVYAVLRAGT